MRCPIGPWHVIYIVAYIDYSLAYATCSLIACLHFYSAISDASIHFHCMLQYIYPPPACPKRSIIIVSLACESMLLPRQVPPSHTLPVLRSTSLCGSSNSIGLDSGLCEEWVRSILNACDSSSMRVYPLPRLSWH